LPTPYYGYAAKMPPPSPARRSLSPAGRFELHVIPKAMRSIEL
jgi:hypothetical protein